MKKELDGVGDENAMNEDQSNNDDYDDDDDDFEVILCLIIFAQYNRLETLVAVLKR